MDIALAMAKRERQLCFTPYAFSRNRETVTEAESSVLSTERRASHPMWCIPTKFRFFFSDFALRYAIGSGKHVLWRRMVREVPELMERSPQEARQRWLRLTGRLGHERGQRSDGPPVDSFYLQVRFGFVMQRYLTPYM